MYNFTEIAFDNQVQQKLKNFKDVKNFIYYKNSKSKSLIE